MPGSPSNFLGLSVAEAEYQKSPVVVIPAPWEKTTSYMKGTGRGPQAIIEASRQVEFYDAELREESWRPGIHTVPPVDFGGADSKTALAKIEKAVDSVLKDGKFPILLGGEHTVTAGAVAAAARHCPDLSILQIDAHADLRESYEGTPYSHACVMRLCLQYVKQSVGVGIRSLCMEEAAFAEQHPGVTLFYDHERRTDPRWLEKVLNGLSQRVYLTIDVDGFEPNLIPATGTPEPGGLGWYEALGLIKAVFQKKKVVGADVVELMPIPSQHSSAFTAAKLAYKLAGYRKKFQV